MEPTEKFNVPSTPSLRKSIINRRLVIIIIKSVQSNYWKKIKVQTKIDKGDTNTSHGNYTYTSSKSKAFSLLEYENNTEIYCIVKL